MMGWRWDGCVGVSISLIVELTRSESSLSDDSEAEAQGIKGLCSLQSYKTGCVRTATRYYNCVQSNRLECGISLTENRDGWTSGG